MQDQTMLCFCGHDCARCITYLATIQNDDTLRKRAQQLYREEFGLEVPLYEIHCKGGRSEEVFFLCRDCPWVQCAKEKGLSACADCLQYPCAPLAQYQQKYVNKCNQI